MLHSVICNNYCIFYTAVCRHLNTQLCFVFAVGRWDVWFKGPKRYRNSSQRCTAYKAKETNGSFSNRQLAVSRWLTSVAWFLYEVYTITLKKNNSYTVIIKQCLCLQCFDTVGWASGRTSSLSKLSDEVLMYEARCTLFAYGPVDATASQNPIISCII